MAHAEHLADRRLQHSSLFLGVQAALLAAMGLTKFDSRGSCFLIAVVAMLGIATATLWRKAVAASSRRIAWWYCQVAVRTADQDDGWGELVDRELREVYAGGRSTLTDYERLVGLMFIFAHSLIAVYSILRMVRT